MNIAAYCRVSTDKKEQLSSLKNQVDFFNDFALLIQSDSCRMLDLLFRLIINTVFTIIIARVFYFPRNRRQDFFFTFILVGFCIFMLIHLMGDAKIKTGIAMGLFAIFCIMRYRTESVPIREMTYLFFVISLAAINALAWEADISGIHPEFLVPELTAMGELILTDLLFLLILYFAERRQWVKSLSSKYIKYDKISAQLQFADDQLSIFLMFFHVIHLRYLLFSMFEM